MDTMNALVWKGDGALSLERRPVPTLQGPRDAIVRVTRSTICTSDLHIRNGAVPRARPGVVLGHEFVGVVEAVGNGISNLRPGDRVAACCESFCGDCWFCRRGYVNNCVHGGWELGCRIDGCQAEYVRVPFADTGLTPIPDALSVWFSSYMATSATVPLGRASRQAAWKVSRLPAHSITASAPRPSVAAATADSSSGSTGLRASATSPCSSAIRRRQGSGSTPMTWAAPSRAAHSAAHSPTGPRPSTTAVSPGWKAHSSAPQ